MCAYGEVCGKNDHKTRHKVDDPLKPSCIALRSWNPDYIPNYFRTWSPLSLSSEHFSQCFFFKKEFPSNSKLGNNFEFVVYFAILMFHYGTISGCLKRRFLHILKMDKCPDFFRNLFRFYLVWYHAITNFEQIWILQTCLSLTLGFII